jgi:hypothetical protein
MTEYVISAKNTFLTTGESRRLQFKRSFSDNDLEAVENKPLYIVEEDTEASLSHGTSDSESTASSEMFESVTYRMTGHSVTIKSESPKSRCNTASPTSEGTDVCWSDFFSEEETNCRSSQKEPRRHQPLPNQPLIADLAAKNPVKEAKKTTIMIRNIPCRYEQFELLEEVESSGLPINFLYMPPARHSVGNLGFAFVNFVKAADAAKFMQEWTGHKWRFSGKKIAALCYAELQGFQANVAYYKKHTKVWKSKSCRPIIYFNRK